MRTSLGSRQHRPLGIFQQLGVSRLGGQFLASAKQLLIPAKMSVANLTTVNERNGFSANFIIAPPVLPNKKAAVQLSEQRLGE
jgi:hypothetical protein